MGEGVKEFQNFSDRELAWYIAMSLRGGHPAWDTAKIGRAVAELDRRLNRS